MSGYKIFVLGTCAVVLAIHIPWAAVALHMAYTQGDFLVKHFRKSKGLASIGYEMERGPWRKLPTIAGIGLAMVFHKNCLKFGMLDPVELASLPLPIRRKLKWIGLIGLTYLSIMMVGGSVVIYVEYL